MKHTMRTMQIAHAQRVMHGAKDFSLSFEMTTGLSNGKEKLNLLNAPYPSYQNDPLHCTRLVAC
jgi:hypothetical protein